MCVRISMQTLLASTYRHGNRALRRKLERLQTYKLWVDHHVDAILRRRGANIGRCF